MATSTKTREDDPGLVGYVGLAILLGLVSWAIYTAYSTYLKARPAVVALSAYFVDNLATWKDPKGSHLKIQGEVHQAGQPVKDGNVRLTVNKQDNSFQQAVSVDMKNGKFESEDPAFFSLVPGD